jgi:hypothetical protein
MNRVVRGRVRRIGGLAAMLLFMAALGQLSFSREAGEKERAVKPRFLIEARLLVTKHQTDPLPFKPEPRLSYHEAHLSTQAALIRSSLVVGRALKKRNLEKLSTLKVGNPADTILRELKVREDAKAGNVLDISYECADAKEGVAIVGAVIESYRDFLDETYRNVSDKTPELITRARDLLRADMSQKEEAYRSFRKAAHLILGPAGESKLGAHRVQWFEAKILHWQIEEKTLRADRDWVKRLGADNPSVQLAARQWAKTAGYEGRDKKVKELVQAYAGHLDDELVKVDLRLKAMQEAKAEAARALREREVLELKEATMRTDIARTSKLLEQTIKRLEEMNLARDFGGYNVRTLSEPRAKEVGKTADAKRPSQDAQLQLQDLLRHHGATHPAVVALKERIALLKATTDEGRAIPANGLLAVFTKDKTNATLKGARIRSLGGRWWVVGVKVETQMFDGKRVWVPLDDVTQMVEVGPAASKGK